VKLFDGDEIFENVTVLTENGIIKSIILNENAKYYGANVIDGTGKTLIPGLINAHVHAFEKEHLQEAARNGVLTLLDLFNKSAMGADSLRSLRDSAGYAYYYSSGPTVTVPGGHGTQFGKVPGILVADNTAQFVADRIAEGCDYIKLIIEKGSASSPIPTLTNEMLSLAINTARKELLSMHLNDLMRSKRWSLGPMASLIFGERIQRK